MDGIMAEESTRKKNTRQKKDLELAIQRFSDCVTAEKDDRILALDDIKFKHGEQWPDKVKTTREEDDRPCLTMNRTARFVKHVVNDIRQIRPAIKIRAVDSISDPKTAEVMGGMIKAIEQSCNAEAAYDWAAEDAVTSGKGYFRITCDYIGPESFDKAIKIKRIRNRFSVYLDCDHKEPDGSDSKYGFVIESMHKDEFKKKYPNAKKGWTEISDGIGLENWYTNDNVQVAEYWALEEETQKLSMLEDGTVQWGVVEDAIEVRDSARITLVQRIITGVEILEEKKYPWKYVPIIPVVGEERDIEGKIHYQGIVRDMKDPARQYNYMRSASVERIALTPKAPWVGPTGAFKSPKWASANTKNYAFLEYDTEAVKEAGGVTPTRTMPPDVSPGITQEIMTSAEELKAVTGIYDAGLGDRSNEVSGVAIDARNNRSDITNFHYVDNLGRSLRHAGRVMVNMIPTIYDKARVVRILRPEGEEEAITVNQNAIDPKTQKSYNYDLTVGEYDVVVDIGPSYATQRQEAVSSMLEILKAFPEAVPVLGDVLAKNMDWADSDIVAKRLKLLLPPAVVADENPQVRQLMEKNQQIITQGKHYIDYLEGQMRSLQQRLENKDGELNIKAGELERKYEEMFLDYQADMNKLAIEFNRDVQGAVV
jgi:hypothetical protein